MVVSSSALQWAAQAWCKPETEHKEMDSVLAEVFAEMLDDVMSQPWLGNATTGELIAEIKARTDFHNCRNINCKLCGLNYKPAGPRCSDG